MQFEQDNQRRREKIDEIVTEAIERARELIQQDVPAETAFRLAFSWQLEILMLQSQLAFQKMIIDGLSPHEYRKGNSA